MRRLNVEHDALFRRIAHNISQEGRQIISVMGSKKNQPFAYTIGNQEKLLPELLLIGNFSATETTTVLNTLSKEMMEQKASLPLGRYSIGRYGPVMIYDGGLQAKARYTYQAGQFYGNEDYHVLQVVLPDKNGKWPDDPLCHKAYKVPILNPPLAK